MARPVKQNADYFSHDKDMRNHPRIKAVRAKFGLEGYAIWCMLLELICDADGFSIDYSTELEREIIAGDFGIEAELLDKVVTYLIALRLLDNTGGFLRSESFSKRMEWLIERRETERIRYENRKTIHESKRFSAQETKFSAQETTQSKVKESKVNKSKVKERERDAPAQDFSRNELSPSANSFTLPVPDLLIDSNEKPAQKEIPAGAVDLENVVRKWCSQNLDDLRSIAKSCSYDPDVYGSVSDEITKFCGHYATKAKPEQTAAFKANPIGYFLEGFKSWLVRAKEYNKPIRQDRESGSPPPSEPIGAFRQRYGAMADMLDHEDKRNLQKCKSEKTYWRTAEAIYHRLKGSAQRTGATSLADLAKNPTAIA